MDEEDQRLAGRMSKKTKKQLIAEYYKIAERTHALTTLGTPFKLIMRRMSRLDTPFHEPLT
jgi:hypothetical protein